MKKIFLSIAIVLGLFTSHSSWANRADLEKAKSEAQALVQLFEGSSGTCPQVSVCGSLCTVLCCPCAVFDVISANVQECFTCPDGRVRGWKARTHLALNKWKAAVKAEGDPGEQDTYNDYIAQISEYKSPRGLRLFETPREADSFKLNGNIVAKRLPTMEQDMFRDMRDVQHRMRTEQERVLKQAMGQMPDIFEEVRLDESGGEDYSLKTRDGRAHDSDDLPVAAI